ncbi:MAG: penicillin-binding protein 1C [Bacteroidetes bacterium]|nr:penicillin-binding protein 1C [Bacteroidota bacterium]
MKGLVNIFSHINRKKKLYISLFYLLFIFWIWLPKNLFNSSYSTVLLDENGELLAAQIADDGQWRFPLSDSVPIKFEKCILAFEDAYFYHHLGVNPVSLYRSLLGNIDAGKIKSGGSTVTMQLARMIRGKKRRNYYQKIIEILLAFRIECSYKKKTILNYYTSNAPFGSNVIGLQAAAWRYFGRSQENLTWAECATLAVLPNAPSLIYPGKNQHKLLEKRNKVLKKIYDTKIIDKRTYELSLQEALPEKPFNIPQITPHLLERIVAEKGKGKKYKTTIRKELQVACTNLLNNHVASLKSNQIYNACVLVAEVNSGKILSYVGNSESNLNEYQNFVDIIKSPRSTGSILKPFLYALMLSEHKLLPSMLLEDVPVQFGSYSPKNYNLTFDGLVPANQALARSLNIPAVKMLQDYGMSKFHHRLKQLGFKTFTRSTQNYGLSLILGGGEATLFDIASAYASLARSLNTFNNSRNLYVTNSYKPLLYISENNAPKLNYSKTDIINASSLWLTFNAMTELLRPQDYVGWAKFLNRYKIAWKTGTSFGYRDAWSVGLTANYIVAVWVGNASGEGRPDLTGTTCAAPLMFSVFNRLTNKQWFAKPTLDFEKKLICMQSGYRASAICPDKKLCDVPAGSDACGFCPFHKTIFLDETYNYRVNSNCYDVSKMKSKAWFITSPLQEYYFKQHSVFYKPLPPYLQGCINEQSINQISIVYPKNNFKLYAPVNELGKKNTIILHATHKKADAEIFWYLDESYIGVTKKFHQLSIMPSLGKHKLFITDGEGETEECNFEVINK